MADEEHIEPQTSLTKTPRIRAGRKEYPPRNPYRLCRQTPFNDPRFQDLTGEPFGRWVVIEYAGQTPRTSRTGRHLWRCRCSCPLKTEKVVLARSLKDGHSTSCGCFSKEATVRSNTRHGQWRSAEFRVWGGMKNRCSNPRHDGFARYGGRGIRVCERWLHSFANFLADMGKRPSPRHSLERKDNDGNYEPGNCVWETAKNQCRNRCNNRWITYRGETLLIPDWSKRTGLKVTTIHHRLKIGWSAEKILTTPIASRKAPKK